MKSCLFPLESSMDLLSSLHSLVEPHLGYGWDAEAGVGAQ